MFLKSCKEMESKSSFNFLYSSDRNALRVTNWANIYNMSAIVLPFVRSLDSIQRIVYSLFSIWRGLRKGDSINFRIYRITLLNDVACSAQRV